MQWFCRLWAGFTPAGVSGGSLGVPWARVEPDQALAKDTVAPHCRAVLLCCSLKRFLWWEGPAVRADIGFQPWLRFEIFHMCGYLLISVGQGSL